jgi:hypothetical protein
MGKKTPLVYILAASHSGSTLLAMLLGSHPEICTVGELKATSLGDTDQYLCSCRRRIKVCPFWIGVKKEMSRRGFDFDITRAGTDFRSGATPYAVRLLAPLQRGSLLELIRDAALGLSGHWRSHLQRVQALNTALIDSLRTSSRKRIIVDSSKVGIRLKFLLRNPHLDVRVVRLIRDGRAVSLTYIDPTRFADATDPEFRGGGTGGDRDSERLAVAQAAREWRRSNEEADAILRRLDPTRWTAVQYESLCDDPHGTLNKIFSLIGVSDQWNVIENFRSVEHHIIGNGMRLDSTNKIKFDDRWKSALNESDLKVFESTAGRLNRRLGYN